MNLDRRTFLGGSVAVCGGIGVPGLAAAAARAAAGPGAPPIAGRRRARALGIRIGRLEPGPWNAITDVAGVRVAHVTVRRGEPGGAEPVVRTGLTAILPADDVGRGGAVAAGYAVPNGNGEMTGLETLDRLGVVASPLLLTGTSHVGVVHRALAEMLAPMARDGGPAAPEPVVAETWDGSLSDVVGRHLGAAEVAQALAAASSGAVEEGAVGGGTGMVSYGFKGGIGTASRRLEAPLAGATVGVLVQANHGLRELLRVDGVPVGAALADWPPPPPAPATGANSLLMVIATDVPLLDFELARVARRAVHGLARTGSISSNSSGDFALAFSTANRVAWNELHGGERLAWRTVDQGAIQPLLEATAEAVEEAIVDALCTATDTTAPDGSVVPALPLDRLVELLAAAGRLAPPEREEKR